MFTEFYTEYHAVKYIAFKTNGYELKIISSLHSNFNTLTIATKVAVSFTVFVHVSAICSLQISSVTQSAKTFPTGDSKRRIAARARQHLFQSNRDTKSIHSIVIVCSISASPYFYPKCLRKQLLLQRRSVGLLSLHMHDPSLGAKYIHIIIMGRGCMHAAAINQHPQSARRQFLFFQS